MQRTQIYLTDEQVDRVAALARDRGTTKAAVIREILDRSLEIASGDESAEDRLVLRSTAGICSGYPDWPAWLSAVRGSDANERLSSLGL